MKNAASWTWVLIAATTAFAACGGTSVKRVSATGDDDDGQGGTSARAGTGGSGGSGARAARGGFGGGSGGRVAAGSGGGTARGGDGGTRAGGGGLSTGGASGRAGAAGSAGSAGCVCTPNGKSIDCRSDAVRVPSYYEHPDECTVQNATVKKSACSDGSVKYEIDDGGEYPYDLELDANGTPVYFFATGYASVVEACGIDPSDYFQATLTTGKKLPPSNCAVPCSICGPADGVVDCGACVVDPATGTARITLDEYCFAAGCPTTLAEAREQRVLNCMLGHSEIVSGCGIDIMQQAVGESGIAYYFDHATGKLQGLAAYDDVPFGPCGAASYQVGTVSDGPCQSVTTCDFCSPAGEAGAGGAAGVAGAGSASLCEP